MSFRWVPVFAAALAAGPAWAVPVEIRTVTPAVPGVSPEADGYGKVTPGQGWKGGAGENASEQVLVFVPRAAVSARLLLLQLFFPGPAADSYFGKFGVDVTTDAEPLPGGRWMPLILETSSASDPALMLAAVPTVIVEKRSVPFVLTLRARVPFDGITGFRLRVFAEDRPEGHPTLGRGADGVFLLGEFRVETDTPRSSNLALGRQVYCSRQVQAGLPSRNLTDGFHATWCQPERSTAAMDAFFQVDLGQRTALDHLVVRRRQGPDGIPPPDGYEVELLTESGGLDGSMAWMARRTAGQAMAPADLIRAADGDGTFAGRSLMIRVKGGSGDQPQIAEIEVYPALRPAAGQWWADGRALDTSGPLTIPPGTADLTFVPLCGTAAEGVTQCRWQLEGWTEEWREAILGQPVFVRPTPPPGEYRMLVQARHTDGVWDTTSLPLKLRAAARWWHHVPSVVAALSGTVLMACLGGWYLFAHRLRGRLARTEQHLELHRDRLRISRDMHDEIGARLTSIAMLAERTQRQPSEAPRLLDDLAHQARTTVEALDTIVWAVNPHHDTVGGLADYLSDYMPAYLSAAGIECLLDFRVTVPDRPLALAVRHNLLMAAKEALRNVVKHAGARHCVVTLTDAPRELELIITDDGCGFGRAPAGGVVHTGMESMRQRLAEAGGNCEFLPSPEGPGARVRLTVPPSAG